jgi:hypothetical protein
MESIAAKEAEIAELKASISDFSELSGSSDVDVEFESVVAKEEKCSCGCEDEAPAEEESCSCGCEDAGDETCCCDDGGDAPARTAEGRVFGKKPAPRSITAAIFLCGK